jgi:hypothetical protein
MFQRRALHTTMIAAAALASVPAAAQATEPQADLRPLDVDVRIQRFAVQDNEIVAKGTARAGLRDPSAGLATATKPITAQVQGGGSTCRVLTLKLDTLQLELLGLRVDTSAVNLLITGRQRGGALGQLFCRLARGIRLGRTATAARAARSLNERLRNRPLRAVGFSASVKPSDQPAIAQIAQAAPAPGSCQVLDLILGPLNLDLLGLRVDLYGATPTQPVRVLITANPTGGILGQVFCRLASGQAATG